jgi:argininosuccinate lyase
LSTPSRSGVFASNVDRRVEQFTESVSFDRRLFAHDITASVAHSQMLAKVGLLTADEQRQIEEALGEIRVELEDGNFEFRVELEDIHMHVEQALIERLGDVGRKLHTGRSRNDQVSTDLRLWIRDEIDDLDQLLAQLQKSFVDRCAGDAGVVLPAYTHLQRAQPVLAAHYWLAYCEKLDRDRERLRDCRRRVNTSTLGTAAVAGSSLPIDRSDVAERLGFENITANSLDSSSDRDFVLEAAFVVAMIANHLSGWAEEWILWSTAEFDYLALPQTFCTGSSIMPQKINPDVLELIRGKTGRVVGNLQALFVLTKGLPLAYNRDLQEDKPPLFDSIDTVKACLELAAPLVAGAELRRQSIAARLDKGHLDATTLMEHLIREGMPQRTAHHLVGQVVRAAMEREVTLSELTSDQLRELDIDETIADVKLADVVGVENALRSFVTYGSTAPDEVARQVERWKSRLGDHEDE